MNQTGTEPVGLGWRVARDVVRVSGPDAERYLQGQLSQDVAGLSPGRWAWALVLQPQGKLDAFVRVSRLGPEEYLLDTDGGTGERLAERLNRFKLRTKADVAALVWEALAVRAPLGTSPVEAVGAQLATALGPATPADISAGPGGNGTLQVPFEWNGWWGYDLLGPSVELPRGVTPWSEAGYELARVAAGFPRHGAELDERTVPAEAGLVGASVSFTKGCYTGQELVARIDSRGSNVPRRLRGIVLSGPVPAGSGLRRPAGPSSSGNQGDGAKELGRLTSVAGDDKGLWLALAYVGRAVEVGAALDVASGPGGEVSASAVVRALPFGPLAPAGAAGG